ncbi:MAG TPA: MFS transporter [Steroidobacteraceae bacterium]|nr:MFS transporter [Steroidobacteraceae bacterium]
MKRLAFASAAGTALEYYDFAVYNTLAALVFGKLFFPSFDPTAALLLSFATYWLGYLSRPFGGLLFGRLGDLRGRRHVLVITLLIMGITTTAVGLLPTYQSAGVMAPLLLVALRFAQGMALGGEWAGAVLLSVEHGRNDQRGRNASWAQMGPSIGVVIASGVIALTTWLVPADDFAAWGWRLPLLGSLLLVVFGLWIRLGVDETPQFRALETDHARSRAPLGEVWRGHRRGLLVAGGSRFGPDVMYSMISAFTLSYMTVQLGLTRTLATTALAIGAAVNAACIFIAGGLSDRFGTRAVYLAGVAAAAGWLWIYFPLLETKTDAGVILAFAGGLAIHAFMYGPQGAFITEQFPTRVRYAGASLAYTFAGVFAGGLAPLAMAALYRGYGTTVVVVLYATVALGVTTAALMAKGGVATSPATAPSHERM